MIINTIIIRGSISYIYRASIYISCKYILSLAQLYSENFRFGLETSDYSNFRSRDTRNEKRLTSAIPPPGCARASTLKLPAHKTACAHALLHRVIEFTARIRRTVHSRCIKNIDEDVVRDNTKRQLLFTFRAGIPRAFDARCNPFSSRRLSACVIRACVLDGRSI